MKNFDKTEIVILLLAMFLIGFALGLLAGIPIAQQGLNKQSITGEAIWSPQITYKLYDAGGNFVGYEWLTTEGVFYSSDGDTWTNEPISYVRKKEVEYE